MFRKKNNFTSLSLSLPVLDLPDQPGYVIESEGGEHVDVQGDAKPKQHVHPVAYRVGEGPWFFILDGLFPKKNRI